MAVEDARIVEQVKKAQVKKKTVKRARRLTRCPL